MTADDSARFGRVDRPGRLLGRVPDRTSRRCTGRRRVRHALPHPLGRTGAGGLRHRVPGGGGHRRAAGGGGVGGSAEAVVDGETGLVVHDPRSVDLVVAALDELLGDPDRREAMGRASRLRAERAFAYDRLADRLGRALASLPVEHPLA